MDPRPIGVFDSGIGGLSAVRALRRLLPEEPILYLGDTARMPYGCRPAGEIDAFTGQITAWLLRRGVKALIAACGTISCNAPSLPPPAAASVAVSGWPLPKPPSAAAALPGPSPVKPGSRSSTRPARCSPR